MPASFGLQTRLLIFRVCICLGLLLPGCYSATARMPAWARNQPLAQNGFVVHPEPGISPLAVEVVTARIADVRDSLRTAYFPTVTAFYPESPLQLVLYRDYRSYRAHTTMLVETLARYDRRLHVVHAPLNAGLSTWRHEMTHALLEAGRPYSPYWLHEGLAFFMMEQNVTGTERSCADFAAVRLPDFLIPALLQIQKQKQIDSIQIFDSDARAIYSSDRYVISAYFILYLWQRGELREYLRLYLRTPDATADFLLTNGNRSGLRDLMHAFEVWLKNIRPGASYRGC